jgi:uncharacterized protein (DUF2147 family)
MKPAFPRIFAFLLFCFLPAAVSAQELKEEYMFGDWVFPENGTVIRYYRCGESLCGKIIKVADPSRRDIHNPDPALRKRPITGIVLFTSTSKKGPTTWRGKLYSTLDGSTYEGTLNLLDKNKFVVVGCIFGNLLCDAKTFIRAEQEKTAAKPQPAERAAAAVTPAPQDRAAPQKPRGDQAGARPEPTRADFDAFLVSREKKPAEVKTVEQREALFAEFLAWWEKRASRSSGARAN